jgi:hypothetical protein
LKHLAQKSVAADATRWRDMEGNAILRRPGSHPGE